MPGPKPANTVTHSSASETDHLLQDSTDEHSDIAVVTIGQQRNRLQRMFNVAYTYSVNGVAVPTLVMSQLLPNLLDYSIALNPVYSIERASIIMASIMAGSTVHILGERKQPFATAKCFTLLNNLCGTASAIGTFAVVGFGLEGIGLLFSGLAVRDCRKKSIGAEAEDMNSMLITASASALVAYATYGATKALVESCKKRSYVNEDGGQNLLQRALKITTGVIESVATYEALRMLLLGAGQDNTLRHEYFPLVVAGIDQLLKCWGHMSRIAHPFNNLVPEDENSFQLHKAPDEENNPLILAYHAPSNAQIATNVVYYGARAAFAITAGGLLALELASYMRAETDQLKLSSQDRLVNLLAIASATGVAEQVFDLGRFVWSKVSQCKAGLFASRVGGKLDSATTEPRLTMRTNLVN